MILQVTADQSGNFARLDMATGLQLRIKQLAVNADLEAAAIGGDQGQRFDFGFKALEKFCRQTGGTPGVVSSSTVNDLDFHEHTDSPK
jgi:hypothetical protein